MEKEEIVQCVNESIRKLIRVFCKDPYFFYTENDLHCCLFRLIYDKIKDINEDWLPIHKDYPTIAFYKDGEKITKEDYQSGTRIRRKYFDIVVFQEKCDFCGFKNNRNRSNSEPCKPFIAIQIGLDTLDDHLKDDWGSLNDADYVEYKYILHFDRKKHYKENIKLIKDKVNQLINEISNGGDKGGICYIDVSDPSNRKIFASDKLNVKM